MLGTSNSLHGGSATLRDRGVGQRAGGEHRGLLLHEGLFLILRLNRSFYSCQGWGEREKRRQVRLPGNGES